MGRMSYQHTLAISFLLVVVALAAVASAQVQCGTLGSFPISGCTTCEETTFNATVDTGDGNMSFNGSTDGMLGAWAGHGGPGGPPGGRGRKLLHGRPGGFGRHSAPGAMPSCTECNISANYVLATEHARRSGRKHGMMGIGRCVCADGFGATSSGPVNVTVDNKTLMLDQFTCATCASGEVPLTHKSGLFPLYNSTTMAWTLVLNTTVTEWMPWDGSRTGSPMQDNTMMQHNDTMMNPSLETSHAGGSHMHAGPHDEPAVRPPWIPGQCVTCPSASMPTSDGVTCVAA